MCFKEWPVQYIINKYPVAGNLQLLQRFQFFKFQTRIGSRKLLPDRCP